MRKTLCAFIIAMLALSLFLQITRSQPRTLAEPSSVSIINPGPDGYPNKWTAYNETVRYLNTSNFIFYSNETAVDSTFFMNVTVRDIERMKGWAIGIIYDNATLAFVSAWRPSDHVFKPPEEMGWTIIAPSVTFEDVNATHKLLAWGCTYIMGTPEWTFNGTGQLCQIQFKILEEVNSLHRVAEAWFAFDPIWTALYQHPTGIIIPQMGTGYFEYTWPVPLSPVLKLEPPTYTALRVNETFNINISINNLDPEWHLVGIQFALVYNTSIFYFVQWRNTTYLEGFVNDGELGVLYVATNDYHGQPGLPICHNKVFVAAVLLTDENGTWHEPFPSGSGVIGTITLKVIAEPPVSCALTLNETELRNDLLVIIPHEVQHSSFNFPYEDNTPPEIDDPTQNPPVDNVQPNQQVKVRVNVTDYGSGVKNVTLLYTNDTTWYAVPMALNDTSGLWEGTIPGYEAGTLVQYMIEAYDKANNYAVNNNATSYFVYAVIPEFPPYIILITFAITLIAVLITLTKPKTTKKPT